MSLDRYFVMYHCKSLKKAGMWIKKLEAIPPKEKKAEVCFVA